MNSPPSSEHPIWYWKANADPFDLEQVTQWTRYSCLVSYLIEAAYQRGLKEVLIKSKYRIVFAFMIQIHMDDSSRQRPVLRQSSDAESISQTESESEQHSWRLERYAASLGPAISVSTVIDTPCHGSPFIMDWSVSFNNGKLKTTFNRMFVALVEGIRKEGEEQFRERTNEIIEFLHEIKNQTLKVRKNKRMKILQEACAKLYTVECFLFKLVNATLRDNDRSKLTTLGPYCHLVYNYIGSQLNDPLSIHYLLRKKIDPTQSCPKTVFRGEHTTGEKIEEYRQAAGKKDKYFRWLPFVSTSRDVKVAESFSRNILYVIDLQRYISNDQFANLENISVNEEQEVLLRPGVRFLVDKVKFDENNSGRAIVHINIVPSYISNLR